jgi:hypothetical protein
MESRLSGPPRRGISPLVRAESRFATVRLARDDEPAERKNDDRSGSPRRRADVLAQLCPVFLSVPLLTLLTGVAFPLVLFALAGPLFPRLAGGSLVVRDRVVGFELIGQNFTGPGYFHPRPSAAGQGDDAAASSGTNLGPDNSRLRDGAKDDPATRDVDESFPGLRELAEINRARKGLAPCLTVPMGSLTRSERSRSAHWPGQRGPENSACGPDNVGVRPIKKLVLGDRGRVPGP